MVALSLLTIVLLVCQLSLYDKDHSRTLFSLIVLIILFFVTGCPALSSHALSNQQNYINAAALGVTTIQFLWEDKENKERHDDKDACPASDEGKHLAD